MNRAGLLLILLAFLCVGQGFGPKIIKGPTPSSSSGGLTPRSIAGLENWWIFTDAVTNNQTLATWTDRQSGHPMTNVPTYTKPVTNTLNGVLFQAESLMEAMTNSTTFTLNSNSAFCIIFKPTNNVAFVQLVRGLYNSDGSPFLVRRIGDSTWDTGTDAAQLPLCVDFAANTLHDFVWTSDDANGVKTYTNGVAAGYTRVKAGQFAPTVIGGANTAANRGLQGYILEVHYWTNVVFTTVNVSNLHYYCTNTYQYAP